MQDWRLASLSVRMFHCLLQEACRRQGPGLHAGGDEVPGDYGPARGNPDNPQPCFVLNDPFQVRMMGLTRGEAVVEGDE